MLGVASGYVQFKKASSPDNATGRNLARASANEGRQNFQDNLPIIKVKITPVAKASISAEVKDGAGHSIEIAKIETTNQKPEDTPRSS